MPANATDPRRPLAARPRWSGAIFVCGKCLKRHDDGKVLRQALKAEVRTASGAEARAPKKTRKAKIIKTACVGLCPRGAIVLASPATLSAGDVLLLRHEDEIAEVVGRLLDKPIP